MNTNFWEGIFLCYMQLLTLVLLLFVWLFMKSWIISLNLIHKRKYTVGLASYVKDNVMEQAGIDKACEILNSFKSFLTSFNIENVSAFTTAALRNAQNSKEAVAEIITRTGIDLHIISGDEEATYDFIAATHELDYHDGFIIDIGGASTELIRFADNKIMQKLACLSAL